MICMNPISRSFGRTRLSPGGVAASLMATRKTFSPRQSDEALSLKLRRQLRRSGAGLRPEWVRLGAAADWQSSGRYFDAAEQRAYLCKSVKANTRNKFLNWESMADRGSSAR